MPYNYFNPKKEFFVIDSENLAQVQSGLYGFIVLSDGIIDKVNFQESHIKKLSGIGTYVLVERKTNEIIIRQDINGSYGLYYFATDDYFAISNSFFRLVEHLKFQFRLSFNRDYANHLLAMGLCSEAYNETMIREISILDKAAVVYINVSKAELVVENTGFLRDMYSIELEDGLEILDEWFARWTQMFRGIKAHTNNIAVALSGGFDSRISFMLAMKSGIDLNEIMIHSINDSLHTHEEDYYIASQIADYYGFKLNNDCNYKGTHVNLSTEDILNICIYNKLPFHKEMFYEYKKYITKRFYFTGNGGVLLRSSSGIAKKRTEYIAQSRNRAWRYTSKISKEIEQSVVEIAEKSFRAVMDLSNINEIGSDTASALRYWETRCRNHFGRWDLDEFFCNIYRLDPLLDPNILKLKHSTNACEDEDTLMALIYTRYCPELLQFKFDSGHYIKEEALEEARRINSKNPVNIEELLCGERDHDFQFVEVDTSLQGISGNNPEIKIGQPDEMLKNIYDSRMFEKTVTKYFFDEIYSFAQEHFLQASYYPMRECYPLIASALVLNAVELSEAVRSNSYEMLVKLGEAQEKYSERQSYFKYIKKMFTARMDVSMTGDSADLELAYVSDAYARVQTPLWLQKEGKGYVIETDAMEIDCDISILSNGVLNIGLKGRDVRDENGNRVPAWIDYTKFIFGNETLFDGTKAAWHDRPLKYSFDVNKGDIKKLRVEWKCHEDERR